MNKSETTNFHRRTVRFRSGDSYCTGWLYLPATVSTSPAPVVVMGHGLGATRELGLAPYAEQFAAAGLAVLAFTYRNLGDSGGTARQVLSMPMQLADWDAAIEHVHSIPEVDANRIAVWGSSLGGGHAIATAARHPELRAAVSQCPFTDGLASAGALDPRQSLAMFGFVTRDLLAAVRRRAPVGLPVAALPGQPGLMTTADSLPGMLALVPEGHQWVNQVAARSILSIIRYRPGRSAKQIAAPILICISATDSVAPPKQTERYARQAPRGDVRMYNAGHFEFYVGEAFTKLVGDQTQFLVKHLQPTPAPSNSSESIATEN